ncbi:MAG: TrmH family RNA methyltransferase [Maribacter sp.]|jgi:TrmH family RNA methyltransferase
MLSKAKIKYIRSLHRKKYRQRYNKFIAEGTKIVDEILNHPKMQVEMIIATTEWINALPSSNENALIIEVSQKELAEVSTLSTPNEVLLVASPISQMTNNHEISQTISLFLDGIQDPGNLGTILRIADWFGIHHVFLGAGTVDVYNPKVVQASMGAFLRVNCIEISGDQLFEQFPDTKIMGADMQGKDVFQLQQEEKKGIVVIGNEGNGISELMREKIKYWISIPSQGGAESLNAAVAAGIICGVMKN